MLALSNLALSRTRLRTRIRTERMRIRIGIRTCDPPRVRVEDNVVVLADAEAIHGGCPACFGGHHVRQRVRLVAHFVNIEVAGACGRRGHRRQSRRIRKRKSWLDECNETYKCYQEQFSIVFFQSLSRPSIYSSMHVSLNLTCNVRGQKVLSIVAHSPEVVRAVEKNDFP